MTVDRKRSPPDVVAPKPAPAQPDIDRVIVGEVSLDRCGDGVTVSVNLHPCESVFNGGSKDKPDARRRLGARRPCWRLGADERGMTKR